MKLVGDNITKNLPRDRDKPGEYIYCLFLSGNLHSIQDHRKDPQNTQALWRWFP